MDELLAKGAIEQSIGGAGICTNSIFVPKCMGHFHLIFNLKHFNHYICIPTFKITTIRQVQQIIQQGYYAFLLIWRMIIYIFLLLSITITFCGLLANTNFINGCFALWPDYNP